MRNGRLIDNRISALRQDDSARKHGALPRLEFPAAPAAYPKERQWTVLRHIPVQMHEQERHTSFQLLVRDKTYSD